MRQMLTQSERNLEWRAEEEGENQFSLRTNQQQLASLTLLLKVFSASNWDPPEGPEE